MHVHRTYAIDGWTFEAHNNVDRLPDGTLDPKVYWVSMLLDDGAEPLGKVLKLGPKSFRAVPGKHITYNHAKYQARLPSGYRTLKDAISDLALEWDRQNPSRSNANGRPPPPARAGKIFMPSLVDRMGHTIVPRLYRDPGWHGSGSRHNSYKVYDEAPEPVTAAHVFGRLLLGGISRNKETGRWWASPLRWNGRHSIHRTLADAARFIVDCELQAPPPLEYEFDEDDEDNGRPEDAVDCPYCDRWAADPPSCALCGGRGWVEDDEIDTYLGSNRIPCLRCDGSGESDGPGPVSWACPYCLGTGRMPVNELQHFDLPQYESFEQDWSGADLRRCDLRSLTFENCDLSRVNFEQTKLAGATFSYCRFHGSNLERASSLKGMRLTAGSREATGMSAEQWALCAARGAIMDDEDLLEE